MLPSGGILTDYVGHLISEIATKNGNLSKSTEALESLRSPEPLSP